MKTPRSRKNDRGASGRRFWESKAAGYPPASEEKTLSRTLGVLDLMARKGIVVEGTRVLDIGCGTGAFALALAGRGAAVTALDFAAGMLERVAEGARSLRLDRVRTIRDSWKEIDVREAGLEKAFEVVLAAFSTAVETEDDLARMERCSTRWCVHVASGRMRRCALYERILRAVGAPLDPRPDVRRVRRTLARMGREPLEECLVVATHETRSPAQVAAQVVNRLEAAGRKPAPDSVLATVSSLCAEHAGEGETVEIQGTVDVGVLMWRTDGEQM